VAYKITKDLLENKASTVEGPAMADIRVLERLRNGEGEAFRLLDDDRIPYYEGLFIDDSENEEYQPAAEFQPLDCYGLPNAGATIIQYKNAAGNWEDL
jgi:hypothetical protein